MPDDRAPLSPFRRLVIADPGTIRVEVHCDKGVPSLWAVIDYAEYERVSEYQWYAVPKPYTFYAHGVHPDRPRIYLHRLIMDAPEDMQVDHIDRDGLNNRRSNLRLASNTQNAHNKRAIFQRAGRSTHSRFKGVSRKRDKWFAYITVQGRREYLGTFTTEVEAARAYDRRALEAFGEFAAPNFPSSPPLAS